MSQSAPLKTSPLALAPALRDQGRAVVAGPCAAEGVDQQREPAMSKQQQSAPRDDNEGGRGPRGQEERHKKDEGRVDNRSPNEPVRPSERGDANRREGGPGQHEAGAGPGENGQVSRERRTERRPNGG